MTPPDVPVPAASTPPDRTLPDRTLPGAAAPDRTTHPGVQRVLAALAAQHVTPEVVTLPDAVRTAAAAAQALGVSRDEIANSLVFRAHDEHGAVTPLLVLASGAHRVDVHKVADLVDAIDHLDVADAQFVRETTGFAIGGVAPVGHTTPLATIVDVSLSRHPYVWAAAGHSHTVFRTTYEELLRVTGGHAMEVA